VGEAAADGVGIWVIVASGVGVVDIELTLMLIGLTNGVEAVGSRTCIKFAPRANVLVVGLFAGVVVTDTIVVVVFVGVLVGVMFVGVFVGVMFVGVFIIVFVGVFIIVFIVVFVIVTAGVNIGIGPVGVTGDIGPIERRALPSSSSTAIDAFLLDRSRVSRRRLCSWCGFIVLLPHNVTVSNPKPT
jgi:hypothetical protein